MKSRGLVSLLKLFFFGEKALRLVASGSEKYRIR